MTDEQLRLIRWQSDMATCCLNMVTLHVKTMAGVDFCAAAYPWDCLDVVANLAKLGDVVRMFVVHTKVPVRDTWSWERQTAKAQRVIRASIMAA